MELWDLTFALLSFYLALAPFLLANFLFLSFSMGMYTLSHRVPEVCHFHFGVTWARHSLA